MAELRRHTGKLKNTGQRCIVVFRELPDEPDSALIVQPDQLPDAYHSNLMSVLDETATQQELELSEILNRRMFNDGVVMLQALHSKGFLTKTSVDNVDLYPLPNTPLPLREANIAINAAKGGDFAARSAENKNKHDAKAGLSGSQVPVDGQAGFRNLTEGVVPTDAGEDSAAVAAGLIVQAELLEQDAMALRDKAYMLDESLRPSKGRPKLSDEERARRTDIKNKKRRDEYASNKTSKKTDGE
jgi:hypothetical protein